MVYRWVVSEYYHTTLPCHPDYAVLSYSRDRSCMLIQHEDPFYRGGGVGDWKDDKMNGHGTMKYVNGDLYQGEWKDGNFNGHGTKTGTSGPCKYEGNWKDGKRHGNGTMKYASGAQYEGDWRENEMHGQGTYKSADGRKFEGA